MGASVAEPARAATPSSTPLRDVPCFSSSWTAGPDGAGVRYRRKMARYFHAVI